MARFVRCIEGHVFDSEAASVCPVCGASNTATVASARAASGAARAPEQDIATVRAAPAAAAPGTLSVAAFAVGAAAIGIAGVVAYLAWFSPATQTATRTDVAIRSDPSPQSAPAPVPAPPVVQRDAGKQTDTSTGGAPLRGEQQLGSRQTDVQAPPSRTEPSKPPPGGTVWSQFSNIQSGQPSQRTPGDASPTPKIALASLPPSDRDAVNGKLARLIEALDRVRRSEPHNNRLLPWSSDIGRRQFSPTPQVAASATRGGWSRDAIAFATYLDAWSALNSNDAAAMAKMENAVGLGSLLAARHLGDVYRQGYREQAANPVHAARWYQAAATQGDPDAAARLAVMHHDGHGVARDATLARRFLIQAITGNSALVRDTVAGAARGRSQDVRTLAAFGIKRDEIPISSFDLWNERRRLGLVRAALDLLDRAANGDRMAMNRLLAMIADKEAFEEDQRVMAQLALESGKRGHPHSAASYGFILSKGPAALAKPGEAPLWMFAAWAFDPKSSDVRELFRLSLEQLPAEQRTGELDFFKAASGGLGLTSGSDRAQRPTPR